jgi:hypothetical protein
LAKLFEILAKLVEFIIRKEKSPKSNFLSPPTKDKFCWKTNTRKLKPLEM